ncbi:hypothetical protein [Domibacillus indicus]|uniref:hypothetical protein n=1 Tax=Domibacillus indicus TaxID=1437523 RepID=UPI0012E0B3D5|nr:hypothetical protein [Domibacillus indicus]
MFLADTKKINLAAKENIFLTDLFFNIERLTTFLSVFFIALFIFKRTGGFSGSGFLFCLHVYKKASVGIKKSYT